MESPEMQKMSTHFHPAVMQEESVPAIENEATSAEVII
jgi:hypothetical protein